MNILKFQNERMVSLDVFRGIVILLLLAEGTGIYFLFYNVFSEVPILSSFSKQFFHAEWGGMHFWDLIQPYFTFIVGVAMVFSLKNRWERGDSWLMTFRHILFRCSVLFFLGIILQSGYREKLVWELWNILTQLSFSILIVFLIFRFPVFIQIIFSLCLLFFTEMLYRYVSIDGFDYPFVKNRNFGTYIDLLLMGKTHPDGWVAFNCIPTTAHMIWGGLIGRVITGLNKPNHKIKTIGIGCLAALLVGYGLDWMGISPINKKISTSSFVIASGGWCMGTFLLLYWLVDIKGYKNKKWINIFSIVGMNPIFIYVFSQTIGRGFLNEFVPIFTKGIMGRFTTSEGIMNFITYITILIIEWYICYWLYKRRIFIKV